MSWTYKVKYFSPKGDPQLGDPNGDLMNTDFMVCLDNARAEIGRSFVITSGFRSTDKQDALKNQGLTETKQSAHTLGQAVDGYFKGLLLLEMFVHMSRWGFSGIGLYPYTNPPVIHVDTMDRNSPRMALWLRTEKNLYVYCPNNDFWDEFRKLG